MQSIPLAAIKWIFLLICVTYWHKRMNRLQVCLEMEATKWPPVPTSHGQSNPLNYTTLLLELPDHGPHAHDADSQSLGRHPHINLHFRYPTIRYRKDHLQFPHGGLWPSSKDPEANERSEATRFCFTVPYNSRAYCSKYTVLIAIRPKADGVSLLSEPKQWFVIILRQCLSWQHFRKAFNYCLVSRVSLQMLQLIWKTAVCFDVGLPSWSKCRMPPQCHQIPRRW